MVDLYKSKNDIYIVRIIWFIVGIYTLYNYMRITEPIRYMLLITAFGCFICSVIAGRWSYKPEVKS